MTTMITIIIIIYDIINNIININNNYYLYINYPIYIYDFAL